VSVFTSKEKRVIGILSTGTFLEYFDFYLYMHFATVLNRMFFATGDEFSTYLMTSFAYCSSYLFRPIGALVFGHIGDKYGRKYVIRITMTMMGLSCIGIGLLPTYESIGIWASIMITLFRAMQGISTMGEIVGAEIYLSEYLKGRSIFSAVAIVSFFSYLACSVALCGIKLVLLDYFDFRLLFIFGISIFMVGYFARRNLSETREYIQSAKSKVIHDPISIKTYIYAAILESVIPIGGFLSIIGMHNIYRSQYGYDDSMIVNVSMLGVSGAIIYTFSLIFLTLKFNPYKLALIRNLVAIFLMCVAPFLFNTYPSLEITMCIHFTIFVVITSYNPMNVVVYRCIPTLKRFKFVSLVFSGSRAVIALISSFGLIVLQPYLGNYVYSAFALPFLIPSIFAIKHFRDLDSKNPNGLLRHYND
jgi:MFS family permease